MTLEPIAPLPTWVGMLVPARETAEILANTEFVPKGLRGRPDAITACILYGSELGIGPLQALASIDVVEGKPRPSAELARALVLRAGHTFTVHEATGTRVRVSGLRAGRPETERVTIDWTIEMARAAGLTNKPNWRSYPRSMLIARGTRDLCVVLFPDVLKGMTELAEDGADAPDLDAWAPGGALPSPEPVREPEPAPIQRRPRAPRKAVAAPVAPPEPAPEASEPDLAPEAVEPEPEGVEPIRGMSEGMRRKVFADVGDLAPNAGREERLRLCSAIIGRTIESTDAITSREGYRLIEWLSLLKTGEADWTWDEATNTGTVYRIEQPGTWEPTPEPAPMLDPWATPGPEPS